MRSILFVLLCTFSLVGKAVELGDSRAEVLAELGEPQSTVAAGNREFLNFVGGRIVLTAGKVSEVQGPLSGEAAAAEPESRASVAPASPRPPPPPAVRHRGVRWLTDIDHAKAEAAKSGKRILALFTGSDWCPPCQKFEAEVAKDQQFAEIFSSSFVFFKNDWLRNTPQPPAITAQADRVRREYGISQYPTLIILNAQGEALDEVDWSSVRGGSFKEIMIEAIDDSRQATAGGKKASSSWWPF